METLIFSEWEEFVNHIGDVTLDEIVNKIKNGFYAFYVDNYRTVLKLNSKVKTTKDLKASIPGFTISGRFSKIGRSSASLLDYYGLMILDLDKLENEEMFTEIFNVVRNIPFTKVAFRSPSGLGIKIIVQTNNYEPSQHERFYKVLTSFYESEVEIKFDHSTCDVARLCFYSNDPDIYFNENSEIFEFKNLIEERTVETTGNISIPIDIDKTFEEQIQIAITFTDNKASFLNGSRNNYIFLLGKNCCGFGLRKDLVIEYCKIRYIQNDFTKEEIEITIENSYSEDSLYFGKWKKKFEKMKNELRGNKPKFPSSIISDKVTNPFSEELSTKFSQKYIDVIKNLKSEHDKDIFILGLMTVLNSLYKLE